MTCKLQVLLMATASFALLPTTGSAQAPCAGAGKAANGDCANESMLAAARQAAVIFSQPKISYTAYPVLPSADRLYRYPNQLMPDQLRVTPVGPGPNFEFPGGTVSPAP